MEKTTQEMATILHLGPGDHGRPLSRDEFETAHYRGGFHYELIEGKLYVSPLPDPPHESLDLWLGEHLSAYVRSHPAVLNRVSYAARVFVPGEEEETSPEPDLAAYENYPFHIPKRQRDWRQIHPVLVAEIVSEGAPDKDLVRNVELYLRVPSIREYWILDPRGDADYPDLLVYRRRGRRWQRPIRVAGGGTYTTRMLPDFSLVLDAHEA
jgi:Uma2 family endonuclease